MKFLTSTTLKLAAVLILTLTSGAFAANQILTANTSWSQISPTPASTDIIQIGNGKTLTIDVGNAQCLQLIVGIQTGQANAGNGTVVFVAGSKLTVSGAGGVTLGFSSPPPPITGTLDMSLGGTLITQSITDSVANFVPGNGTITFVGSSPTLPASAAFATYNGLSAPGNTVALSQNISVSTLYLGNSGGGSGVFDLTGHNLTANSISILGGNANTITANTNSTLTVNVPTGTLTYAGALTGGGLTLAKDGLGSLIISGSSNTYGGQTQVLNGTLQLGNPNCLPPGQLVLGTGTNSGSLDVHGYSQSFSTVTVSGTGPGNTITNSTGNGQLTLTNANGTNYSGGITGSSLTLNLNSSGTFTLSGGNKNTFSGNINVQQGTLAIGADNSLSQSTIVTLGNNATAATLDLVGHNQVVAGLNVNGSSLTNTVTSSSGMGNLTVGSTVSQVASSAFLGQFSNVTLSVDAGTTLTFGGTPNFGTGLNVLNGTFRCGQAFSNFPPVTLGNAGTSGVFDLNGFDQTVISLASSGFSSNNQVRDASGLRTLTLNQGGTTTFNGQSSAILFMNGSGTLTLGQSSSISTLKVGTGTVKAGAANIFTSGNSALVVGNGASTGIFDLNGFSQTVGTITNGSSGANQILSNGGAATLTIQNSQPNSPFSYLGQINGPLSLIVSTNSSSSFTYAGGGYSGGTTVNSGGIILPVGASTGGTFVLSGGPLSGYGSVGQLTVNPNAVVSPGDNITVGTISCSTANFSNGGILKIKLPSDVSTGDKLNVSGALTLGGTSQLVLDLTGYTGAMTPHTFNIVQFNSIAGSPTPAFNSVTVNANTSGYAVNVNYTANAVQVVVGAVPTVTPNAFPTATAGVAYNYNISASNSPSSYTATGLPPGLNLNASFGSISGTPTTAGNYTVTMTATNKGGTSAQVMLPLTVNPGPVAKLQILLPGESPLIGPGNGKTGTLNPIPTAGGSFNVTVNAVDANWNVVPTVNDAVSFSSNDPFAVLPSGAGIQLANGTNTFSITLKAASPPPPPGQPTTITVNDSSSPSVQPSISSQITVNAAAFSKLQLILPGENAAPGSATGKTGTPAQEQATVGFPMLVNAVDDYWNVVNVSDTVSFSSTDPKAALPAPGAALVNGTGIFNATLNLGPAQSITVSDITNPLIASSTSPSVNVKPGAFVRLQVLAPGEINAPGTPTGKTGTPSAQTGGASFQVTVNAVDVNYTIVPVTDLVQISSSDPAPTLPSPATANLVAGTATFNLALTTGPSQTVSANDVTDPSKLSGTSTSIPVNTITSTLTSISPSSGVRNGAAFTITVSGTNFLANSVVQWNGSTRPTIFVSSTQLTATIPASDLTNEGRMDVTVFSPPPGTGATASQTFFVYSGSAVGTWVVRNTNDSGQGSLRLAMTSCQKGDLITFDPTVFDLTNSNAATFINVLSALPTMDKGNVTLDASYQRVTINGSGAGSSSGLVITSSNNKVMGLSIIGFSRSGVSLEGGAQNNTIGGSRTIGNNASGTPPGPNGQGLRISGNGTFGVQISDATTSGNVIKGCWIGLDISGTAANPNLAGILLQNGAHDNTIGGTGDGEQNVISGNAAEGITVSGTGSDSNTVIANVIGIAAVASSGTVTTRDASDGDIFSRSAVANGSSGIFLSRGTQNTAVGLSSSDDESMTTKSNVVGYNGGSGIEVRASTSKKNSSRGNRISHNGKKGIALFDGSNGGITAPSFTSVTIIGGRSDGADTRATSTVRVVGSATNGDGSAGSGTIEVFSDSSDQGATILGRSSVVAGAFDMQVSVADLSLNLTATYTDANGNTSPYAIYGALNSGGTGAADPTTSALDTLLGIDPTNPSEVPAGTGTATVGKFTAGLNFAKSGHDTIQTAQFAIQLPTGFSAAGATVGVVFDANAAKVTLDAKGKSPAGNTSVKIAASKTGSLGVVTVSIRNANLLSGFASSGLTNKTTAKAGEQDTIPVGLALQTSDGSLYIYTGTVTVTYKATQGKSGKAMK